jgi:hypothetical protein
MRGAVVGGIALASAFVFGALPANAQTQRWFRGNTHTHTLNSDGDSPPDSVARWYRDHGYAFLFITDHETLTDPAPLNARFGKPGAFLLIKDRRSRNASPIRRTRMASDRRT